MPEDQTTDEPTMDLPDWCQCGHSRTMHTGIANVCWIKACRCREFRPARITMKHLDKLRGVLEVPR